MKKVLLSMIILLILSSFTYAINSTEICSYSNDTTIITVADRGLRGPSGTVGDTETGQTYTNTNFDSTTGWSILLNGSTINQELTTIPFTTLENYFYSQMQFNWNGTIVSDSADSLDTMLYRDSTTNVWIYLMKNGTIRPSGTSVGFSTVRRYNDNLTYIMKVNSSSVKIIVDLYFANLTFIERVTTANARAWANNWLPRKTGNNAGTLFYYTNFMMWNNSKGDCPAGYAYYNPTTTGYVANFSSLGYDTTNNTLPQLINFSCKNNQHYLWFGLTNPPTNKVIDGKTYGNYTLDSSNIVANNYYYYIASCNQTNSSVYYFRYDNIQPNITFYKNNEINFTHNSSIFINKSIIILNFSITDNIGFLGEGALEILIANDTKFNGSSIIYYNYTNISVSGYQMNYSSLIKLNATGTNYIRIMAADVHNVKWKSYGVPLDKPLYNIIKTNKKLDITTIEKNNVILQSDNNIIIDTIREKDKYKFKININKDIFGNIPETIKFELDAENINYIPSSSFKGHFIINNPENIFNKNFVDFENDLGIIPIVKEKKRMFGLGKKYYEIEININNNQEIIFKSIGGVNVNEITASFNVTSHKIKNVRINPSNVAVDEMDLTFYGTVENFNKENTTLYYQIFKNGIVNTSILSINSIPEIEYNLYLFSSYNTSIGDNYTISARSFYLNNYSDWINSSITTIKSLVVDDCTVSNSTLINFSSIDENLLIPLNISRLDANFEYSFDNVTFYNYSVHKSDIFNFKLCVYPNATWINLNGYLQYNGQEKERYYIEKAYLFGSDSSNNQIYIYNFNDSTGLTEMAGTGYNYYYQYYTGVVAKLQRYYPGNNSWLSVQNDKIDNQGKFLFYVVENTVDYRIIWEQYGEEIARTDKLKFICETGTSPCVQSFLINPTDSTINKYRGMNQYGIFDNLTNIYSFTWTDTNNIVSSVRLIVSNYNSIGNNTVCDTTTSSSSGTITCNLSGVQGLISVKAIRTASPGDPFFTDFINLMATTLKDIIASKGYTKDLNFMFFLVSVGISGLAAFSPVAGVVAIVGTLYLIFWLNLFTWLSLTFVITFGVVGLLVAYALRR